jgi:hypothetical protein
VTSSDPDWYRMKTALVRECRDLVDHSWESRDLVINVAAGTVRDQRDGALLRYFAPEWIAPVAPAGTLVRALLPWRSHMVAAA